MPAVDCDRSSNRAYSEEALPPFMPFDWYVGCWYLSTPFDVKVTSSMQQIRYAIPPDLFTRDTRRGLLYFARDLAMAAFAWKAMMYAEACLTSGYARQTLSSSVAVFLLCAMWLV